MTVAYNRAPKLFAVGVKGMLRSKTVLYAHAVIFVKQIYVIGIL